MTALDGSVLGRPGRGARTARTVGDWAPAAAVLVLGLVLWEGLVDVFEVQRFLLPKPTEIGQSFWDERDVLWSAGWFTFKEAVGGWRSAVAPASSRPWCSRAGAGSAPR